MARPIKATVDYFPCDCQFTDSIKAVENLFGNNGFVVWIKTLQKLGRTDYHVIDVRQTTQWKLFYSLFRIDETEVINILDTLADLGCIDKTLWENKIIYSENFVKRVSDAYRNRKNELLTYEQILATFGISDVRNSQEQNISNVRNSVSYVENTQTKLNKTKVNKEKIYKKEKFKIPTIEEIKAYCSERNNRIDAQYFFDYYSSKGWVIGKTKMKDWKAAVRTWERNIRNNQQEITNENVYNFD